MRILTRFLFIVLSGTLFTACKKDAKPTQTDYNAIVETQPAVLKPVVKQVNDAIGGYYAGLPFYYNQTTKNYPLLIFIPGGGQTGDGHIDLPLLLNDGIAQLMDDKKFPPNFLVDGKNYSFISLTPQFNRYPTDADVEAFIIFAKKNYRVDTSRIYMSGLSLGGTVSTTMGGEYTAQLAAIVPIAGVVTGADMKVKSKAIAAGNLPVWVFHNSGDPLISALDPINFVSAINSFHPTIAPILTLFNNNVHDAWTKAIDPKYKENNINIYEWMLHYTR